MWFAAGVGCCALVLFTGRNASALALPARVAFAIAFLAVSAEILLVSRLAPVLHTRALWGSALASGGLLSLVAGARLTPESAAMATAALLWTGSLLGAALGARIDKPGHVAAVAAVSGLADLWSVYDPAGPSAVLAQRLAQQPEQISAFALCFPLLGTRHIPPLIGAGDLLFAALYLAAYERHGLALRRAMLGLAAAFTAGMALLLWLERPLPLLPLMGAAVVLADARALARKARRAYCAGRSRVAVGPAVGAAVEVTRWRARHDASSASRGWWRRARSAAPRRAGIRAIAA